MWSTSPCSSSRSVRGSAVPRKSNRYGSLNACVARSEVYGRQRPREVGDGTTLALVQPVLDLNGEHVAAPARFARLGGVPEAHAIVVNLLQQCDIVVPGDLCKHLLHDFALGPGLRRRRACT